MSPCEALTLKARRSIKCDIPLFCGVSYRLPASTYTPTAWKWPGVDSVTTRSLFGNVVTCGAGGRGNVDVDAKRDLDAREPIGLRILDLGLRTVVMMDVEYALLMI